MSKSEAWKFYDTMKTSLRENLKEGSIYDYFPDAKNKMFGEFDLCSFMDKTEQKEKEDKKDKKTKEHEILNLVIDSERSNSIFVHTQESRIVYIMMRYLNKGGYNIWVEGNDICGKTTTILHSLKKLKINKENKTAPLFDFIFAKCEKNLQSSTLQSLFE